MFKLLKPLNTFTFPLTPKEPDKILVLNLPLVIGSIEEPKFTLLLAKPAKVGKKLPLAVFMLASAVSRLNLFCFNVMLFCKA